MARSLYPRGGIEVVAISGFMHNKLTSLCIKYEHSRFDNQL